jgi:hypothetical protein
MQEMQEGIGVKVEFKLDSKGVWLVRFKPIGDLPTGLKKYKATIGFVDIAGVYEGEQVAPIDYDELLKQIRMDGRYSDFKELLGYWMEERELMDGPWYRISITLVESGRLHG